MSSIRDWGSTAAERSIPQPCDAVLPMADDVAYRAVTVDATPATVYRWLCQLRAAPYSYDLIDNFGRRSPRRLIAGLDDLEVGQKVMTVFRLASYEPERHLTIVMRGSRMFGDVAVTYAVRPRGDGTRLLAKLRVRYPRTSLGRIARRWLMPGDLLMMRKQLRTLKRLAERSTSQ